MTFSKLLFPFVLIFSLVSSVANAFPWDEWTNYNTIYSRGNWVLDQNYYNDGSQSCESRTDRNGYRFSIFTLSSGDYVIQFANDNWSFGDTMIGQDFVVQIDRHAPWEISGNKLGSKLSIVVTPPSDSLSRFFSEVARGITLYLMNDRGVEITRFSLRGTSRTLDQHRYCERQMFGGGFGSRSDPFN